MRRELIIRGISEATFERMKKKKEIDGFKDRDWASWLEHHFKEIPLQDTLGEAINRNTMHLLELWVQNFTRNLPRIWSGQSISNIVPPECIAAEREGRDPNRPLGTGIVVGRGPSLFANKHLELLAESGYNGVVIASDGALIECLKRGVIPDYTVSVDGNREKIWRWYDHPLVDKYGHRMTAILSSTVAPNVPERCERAGMRVCFFNPLFDNWLRVESFTKMMNMATKCEKLPGGLPSIQCGGHAGATAWVLGWALLRRSPISLIGIDLGYREDDDLSKTYYWDSMLHGSGGNLTLVSQAYERVFNPEFRCYAVVDPVFKYYRESFIQLSLSAPPWVETINSTEGGSLFGGRIKCMPFKQFLEMSRSIDRQRKDRITMDTEQAA